MTDDLATWLRAQLNKDAAKATEAAESVDGTEWRYDDTGDDEAPVTVVHPAGKMGPPEARWPILTEANSYIGDRLDPRMGRFLADNDPARVLREVEAKRQIVEGMKPCPVCLDGRRCTEHDASAGMSTWRFQNDADERIARLLGLPYADRPGYKEEWKP